MSLKHDYGDAQESAAIFSGRAIATPDYSEQHPSAENPFRLEDEWLKNNPDRMSRETCFYLGALAVLNLLDQCIRDSPALELENDEYHNKFIKFGRELTHECRHHLYVDSKENPS